MAAKDLGNKYSCFKCSTKFYDLKKPVPSCPKCGADQRDAPVPKASGSRKVPPPRVVEEPAEVSETEEEDLDVEDEEADEPAAADEE